VGKGRFTAFGTAEPDPEMRARVAAAEQLADAAAAQEATIDRKVHAFVTVMQAHGLTVKDLDVLRRRLQNPAPAGAPTAGASSDAGPHPALGRIAYDLTPDDYVAFNVHTSLALPETRRQIAQGRAWGAVLMAVVAGGIFGLVLDDGPVVPLVFASLAAVAWWVVSPWTLRRGIRRSVERIARTSGLGVVGPASLEADEVGLCEDCAGVVNTAPWSSIQRIEETPTHAFIHVGPLAAVIVPKRAAGAEDLIRVVRARIGQGRPTA